MVPDTVVMLADVPVRVVMVADVNVALARDKLETVRLVTARFVIDPLP